MPRKRVGLGKHIIGQNLRENAMAGQIKRSQRELGEKWDVDFDSRGKFFNTKLYF